MPPLESSLLKTILFFELLQYRVSVLELSRITGISVSEVRYGMLILVRKGIVIEQSGMYVLARHSNSPHLKINETLSIAWRRVGIIRWIARGNPFIKAIAIGNSLAMGNFREGSDIDLLIIAKKNRLYVARLLFVIPLMLLRLRPRETKRAPLCVSFVVDESALLMNEYTSQGDIYFAHWCSSLVWVYDVDEIAVRFMKENAHLMTTQGLTSTTTLAQVSDDAHFFTRFISSCNRVIDFNWCENIARRFELWYLPHQVLERARLNTSSVVITPTVFKTHLKDRREEIATQWHKLCELYGCL